MGTIMGELVEPEPMMVATGCVLDNACKIHSQRGNKPGEVVFNFVKAEGKVALIGEMIIEEVTEKDDWYAPYKQAVTGIIMPGPNMPPEKFN